MRFGDPTECYRAIGALLAGAITEPWKETVVDVKLVASAQSVELINWYVPKADDTARKHLPYVPGLGRCFYDLAPLLSTEDKGYYKRCVFTLWPDGRYDAQFVYENASQEGAGVHRRILI